jgi:ferredoxin
MRREFKNRGNDMEKIRLIDRLRIPTYDSVKQMQTGDLIFDKMKCRQCGTCIKVCPGGCILTDTTTKMDILSGGSNGGKCGMPRVATMKTGATLCIACYDCGAACPHGAITIKNNFNPGFFYKRLSQTSDMRYPKNY